MGTDASGQGPNHSTLADTPLVVARQIDQICDRFESALGRGDRPTLAEFLDQLPAEATSATRRTLLHELIRIDLEYGWRSAHQLGQTATWHGKNRTTVSDASTHHAKQRFDHGPYVEDYLDRFRDLGSREHVPPELVRAEYRARCRWGDRPSHDEYFERFAGLASLKTALAEVDEELQLSMDSVQPQGVTNFDDFDIIAEISRGGMGVVYKARQRSLNRIVAVKMILTGAQASEQEVTRFRREAEGAAALDHVGIVPIYQIGEHDGNHYFSMAYIDGPSLARHLDNGPLPIKDAAQLMLKLARALHYAHQRGVVHRDLKPANVLIDNNGEPKVTDFGLAKLVDQARRDTRLTTTGQILGTPSFMAPEQAAGQSESATHLADVYALGAIFYHVLTGRPPFQAHTAIETLKQVMTNEPVSPALLNARIPRDAATICLKCLEKNPARRYASANDLAEELERLLDGAPIKARPVSNVEKLWRWMRRNPWRARVAGLLIVLAAVVPLLAFIAIYDYIRRAPLEEQNRQAKQHFDREVASLQQRNYVAEMNLLESAWNSGDLRRAYELLQAQRPIRGTSDPRGFEWFLRWRMYHHQPLRIQPVQKWNGLDPWCCAVEDNAVLLWDSAADRVLFSAQGHAHWVTAIAVSPDGETMATGGRDAAVILWDLATSAERARITAHRGGIVAMAFAPDGRQIATAANDHTVCLSDLTRSPPKVTRLQIDPSAASTHRATVWSVAYSPDGSLLASASHDRTIAIWNPRTKQLINVLEGHELGIRAVAFAPNLRWLVSAGDDGTIRQWPLVKPGSPRTLPEFGKANHRWRALDVSQDASVLAAGDNNGFIVLWDLASREIRRQWKPHHRAVVKLFFSPDDSRLVSTSSDGTAAIVDIVDGQVSPLEVPQRALSAIPRMMRPKVELASPIGRINDLAFSHDSTVLIGAGVANDKDQGDDEFVPGGHVTLWRVTNSPEVTSTLHQAHEITSLAVSPTEALMALGARDGAIHIVQIDSGNQLASFAGHQDRVTSLQFSTSGDRLWSLTASGKRTGYDLQTRQEIESDQLRVVDVSTSTISSAGMIAAIADGAPERICIFDPRSSPDERELPGHTYEVLGLAFSRQGDILASVGRDRYVRLREVPVGDARLLRGHAHWSTCVAISPDGKTLATGSRGGEAILWSLPTGRPLMRLPTHGHGIARIAFAPDGRRLAVADIQANVWMWEVFLTENDPWSVLGAGQ